MSAILPRKFFSTASTAPSPSNVPLRSPQLLGEYGFLTLPAIVGGALGKLIGKGLKE